MARYYQPYGFRPSPLDQIKAVAVVTVLIIIVILVIYFSIRAKANKDSKGQLPNEYADEAYNKEEGIKIRSYATQIQDEIKGVRFTRNRDIYYALLKENDRIFTGVCIDYKRLAGTSLREDLNDEVSFSFTLKDSTLRKSLIARMNMLNIF